MSAFLSVCTWCVYVFVFPNRFYKILCPQMSTISTFLSAICTYMQYCCYAFCLSFQENKKIFCLKMQTFLSVCTWFLYVFVFPKRFYKILCSQMSTIFTFLSVCYMYVLICSIVAMFCICLSRKKRKKFVTKCRISLLFCLSAICTYMQYCCYVLYLSFQKKICNQMSDIFTLLSVCYMHLYQSCWYVFVSVFPGK